MVLGARRLLGGAAVGAVIALGGAAAPALAETVAPTPAATATATAGSGDGETPDVAPDNSRTAWALGGAGLVAVIAATVVFLRRG